MRYWIVIGVCLGLGCSKSEAGRQVEVSSAEETATVDQTAAQPEELSLELIAQGKPPLRKLRWRFTEGSEQEIEIELTFLREISEGARKAPSKRSPPILVSLAVTTKELASDGRAQAEVRITNAAVKLDSNEATPRTAALERSVASIIGASASYAVEPNGLVKEIAFETPRAPELKGRMILTHAIKAAAMQLVGPLPEQPVGVGAKWSLKQTIKQPQRLDRTATYELVKLEGDQAEVEILVEQSAPPQTLGAAPAAGGQAARIEAYQSKDHGKVRWDLTSLAPRSAELVTTWNAEFTRPAMDGEEGAASVDESASFESDMRIRRK